MCANMHFDNLTGIDVWHMFYSQIRYAELDFPIGNAEKLIYRA